MSCRAWRILSLGVSVVAMAAGAAEAQDEAPASAAATAAAPAEAGASQAGDIIVTAQRRSERLRDVPISVTALNAEALSKAGVANTLDIGRVTPGVVIPFYGAYILPSIRGISSNGSGVGDSPNVAIYIDGIFQANHVSGLSDLPDVQSVQILKGPQGSLYGQNAAGGAIIVDTITPSFKLKGQISASYGNYDSKKVSGFVTGPLTDTIAVAFSGLYHDRDGFRRDILRGGHDKGLRSRQARGKVLWQPNSSTSLTLQAFYTKRFDTGPYAGQPLKGNSLGKLFLTLPCAFGGYACEGIPTPTNKRQYAFSTKNDTQITTYGVSLLGKFGLGDIGTLNTVASYKHAKVVNFSDVDQTPVNIGDFFFVVKERDYIGELNFASNKFGALTINAGAFFMDKVERYVPQVFNVRWPFVGIPTVFPDLPEPLPYDTFAGTLSDDVAKNHKKSYAVYGELNYDITDQLTVTAAGRYSWETQTVYNSPLPVGFRLGDPLPKPVIDPRGAHHFSKFTPRFVLRYKPDNNNTIYASYSKGFKSGYVNNSNVNACKPRLPNGLGGNACVDKPVKPETVDAFEIGYKGRIGSRLNLTLAAFHYKYKDIQVFVYNPVEGSTYQNAASGKITGAEVELSYKVTPELTFNGGASYLHARYASFPSATVYIPNACSFASGACGNTQTSRNVKGNEMMRTPQWTANASLNWEHKMAAGNLGAYVGANYNSGMYFDPLNRAHQKPYALVDAELSFAPSAVPGLRLVLWGKNLTDHNYLQSVLESQLADAASYADPRTYGIRAEFKF